MDHSEEAARGRHPTNHRGGGVVNDVIPVPTTRGGAEYVCLECGAPFTCRHKDRKFCSHKCAGKANARNPQDRSHFGKNGHEQGRGPRNPGWKGDAATYRSVHSWVTRNFGTPRLCEHCGTTDAAIYDWSSKHGTLSRDRNDWQRLCRSCHMKYDYAHGMRTPARGPRGR